MTPRNDSEARKPVPRIDSFEVIEADCSAYLTDEEKTWPVVAVEPRVDSFEVIEDTSDTAQHEAVIRVRVDGGATPSELAAVVDAVRAAVEAARAATGGRVPITLDAPPA